jgi:hypothetical protein
LRDSNRENCAQAEDNTDPLTESAEQIRMITRPKTCTRQQFHQLSTLVAYGGSYGVELFDSNGQFPTFPTL